MSQSTEFVIQRAHATRSAQADIAATWVWDEKTLAEWDTDIAAVHTQDEVVADAEADKNGLVGELDALLAAIHDNTVKGLNIAKAKYRNDPAKIHLFKSVTAHANSRAGQLEEALEFESAWQKADAAWEPVTGMTLAGFKTARLACETKLEAYSNSKANWRGEAENFNVMIATLDDACMGWYKAATAVFPEGTAEGDMIRGTIPTTYTPPPDVPGKAVITSLTSPADGEALIVMEAENAVTFNVLVKAPAETNYVELATDVTGPEYHATGFDVGGVYSFKVVGVNSGGAGEQSDEQSVQIDKP